jgi:hypothetical protein
MDDSEHLWAAKKVAEYTPHNLLNFERHCGLQMRGKVVKACHDQ